MCSLYRDLSSECCRIIGQHFKLRFWHDNWLGTPLSNLLPHANHLHTPIFYFLDSDGGWSLLMCFKVAFPWVA